MALNALLISEHIKAFVVYAPLPRMRLRMSFNVLISCCSHHSSFYVIWIIKYISHSFDNAAPCISR